MMNDELSQYVDELFVREDEMLAFVRRQTAERGLPQINLQPGEGRMIQLLVMMSGARRVIEVGTLAGYSAIWIARGLPPDGRLITIEKSGLHARLARSHLERAGLDDKVTVMQGDGLQILRKLKGEAPYDLVFIDADKPGYPHYLQWAVQHLRIGGTVMAHNAFRGGHVLAPESEDDEAVVRFNQALAQHPALVSTILGVGDGLALGVKVS